ncbi:MAG: PilZ domain-containing protein [Candidatus Eisenbacteria bacterium]
MEESKQGRGKQRREYFRSPIGLCMMVPVSPRPRIGPRDGVPFLPPAGDGADYRMLRLHDLSGGGCCCEVDDDWPGLRTEHTGYLYLDDGRGPLELDLLVVRRGPAEEVVQQPDAFAPPESGESTSSTEEPGRMRDRWDASSV